MTDLYLPDAAATHALGVELGRRCGAGDVLAAEGPLGAGKTSLAQGLARGLGVPADHYVNSPTYAILQIHPGRVPFCHVDLYRIEDPDEAYGLGLEESVGTDGVAYVEWPRRLPDLIPPDALWIRLTPEGTGRRIVLSAQGGRGARILEAFAAARKTPSS